MFVAEVIRVAAFRCVNICKEAKIEAIPAQLRLMNLCFSVRVQVLQDFSVFAQNGIYFPHIPGAVSFSLVVIGIPALVGAEFFVNSACECIATNWAAFFFIHPERIAFFQKYVSQR